MKGQMQMNETIIVIFLVSLMLLLGFIFYVRWESANLEKTKFNYERENFELLIGKIPAMAEFQCSSYGQGRECMDVSKLIAFREVSNDYFDIFGYKNITIIEVYPEGRNLECNKGNHLNCGVYSLYYKKKASLKDKLIISSPVSLYYPDTEEYKIGKLIIEWYT